MATELLPDGTSPEKSINPLFKWLNDRLDLVSIWQLAQKKEVPIHKHSIWYYMGGITLMFLIVQIITGILLMIYYVPDLNSAHASILKINTRIDFGWFVRSLHCWAANLMIFVVFLHLFSTYFMKAYRKPREITWLIGMGLLVLVMGFGFTGYLLPWDQVSLFATKIGLDITSKVPVLGDQLATVLRGGSIISQNTLSRFFTIHVIILPLLLFGLLGIHLLLIQLQGISTPKSIKASEVKYEKFFPDFIFKDLLVWILALNVLFVLVTFLPWGLGEEADPFAPAPIGIKPEWYFLAMFQFLKLIPAYIGPIEGELFGITIIGLIVLILGLVPFWDTGASKKLSKLATYFGLIVLLSMIIFSIWGALS